jgi:hypothetical protein
VNEAQPSDLPEPADRVVDRIRRAVAVATAVMVVLSWPLWTGGGEVPRVPFAPIVARLGPWADTVAAVVMLGGIGGTACAGRWRPWFGVGLGALAWLVAGDQHRFQPWAYQFAMTGLFAATRPSPLGLRLARWWFVALYAHSALSKLDVSFVDGLGLLFLRTALAPAGLDPAAWPATWRVVGVLALPAGEMAVATALAVWPDRRVGRIGAAALHLALLGILGPFGLGHSTIVLAWNVAMLAEVWIAFAGPPGPSPWAIARPASVVVLGLFAAGIVLPFGERWGVFDIWPSHALYASHVERLDVYLHDSERDAWPAELRLHLDTEGEAPWRRVNLTDWSRALRGTPVYPQNRATLGLAEALAARYRVRLVRVVAFGPAERWTGRRDRVEAVGRDAIRTLGSRSWLNAHPVLIPATGTVAGRPDG